MSYYTSADQLLGGSSGSAGGGGGNYTGGSTSSSSTLPNSPGSDYLALPGLDTPPGAPTGIFNPETRPSGSRPAFPERIGGDLTQPTGGDWTNSAAAAGGSALNAAFHLPGYTLERPLANVDQLTGGSVSNLLSTIGKASFGSGPTLGDLIGGAAGAVNNAFNLPFAFMNLGDAHYLSKLYGQDPNTPITPELLAHLGMPDDAGRFTKNGLPILGLFGIGGERKTVGDYLKELGDRGFNRDDNGNLLDWSRVVHNINQPWGDWGFGSKGVNDNALVDGALHLGVNAAEFAAGGAALKGVGAAAGLARGVNFGADAVKAAEGVQKAGMGLGEFGELAGRSEPALQGMINPATTFTHSPWGSGIVADAVNRSLLSPDVLDAMSSASEISRGNLAFGTLKGVGRFAKAAFLPEREALLTPGGLLKAYTKASFGLTAAENLGGLGTGILSQMDPMDNGVRHGWATSLHDSLDKINKDHPLSDNDLYTLATAMRVPVLDGVKEQMGQLKSGIGRAANKGTVDSVLNVLQHEWRMSREEILSTLDSNPQLAAEKAVQLVTHAGLDLAREKAIGTPEYLPGEEAVTEGSDVGITERAERPRRNVGGTQTVRPLGSNEPITAEEARAGAPFPEAVPSAPEASLGSVRGLTPTARYYMKQAQDIGGLSGLEYRQAHLMDLVSSTFLEGRRKGQYGPEEIKQRILDNARYNVASGYDENGNYFSHRIPVDLELTGKQVLQKWSEYYDAMRKIGSDYMTDHHIKTVGLMPAISKEMIDNIINTLQSQEFGGTVHGDFLRGTLSRYAVSLDDPLVKAQDKAKLYRWMELGETGNKPEYPVKDVVDTLQRLRARAPSYEQVLHEFAQREAGAPAELPFSQAWHENSGIKQIYNEHALTRMQIDADAHVRHVRNDLNAVRKQLREKYGKANNPRTAYLAKMQSIADHMEQYGGGTFRDGVPISEPDGYRMAVTPGNYATFVPGDTSGMMQAIEDVQRNFPDHEVGMWYDPDLGLTVVEPSMYVQDLARAKSLARHSGQKAIWDNAANNEIQIGKGKPGATKHFGVDPEIGKAIQQHQADLESKWGLSKDQARAVRDVMLATSDVVDPRSLKIETGPPQGGALLQDPVDPVMQTLRDNGLGGGTMVSSPAGPVPGGRGPLTEEQAWLTRSHNLRPNLMTPADRTSLYDRLFSAQSKRTVTPMDAARRMMFAVMSSSTDLGSNETFISGLGLHSLDDIHRLADMSPQEISSFIKEQTGVSPRYPNVTGSYVKRLATTLRDDPTVLLPRAGETGGREETVNYLNRLATIPGVDMKIANFMAMLANPKGHPIGTMDRHMVRALLDRDHLGQYLSDETYQDLASRAGTNKDYVPGSRIRNGKPEFRGSDYEAFSNGFDEAIRNKYPDGLPFGTGGAQWMEWDIRRGIFEPHATLWPGNENLPPLSPDQKMAARISLRDNNYYSHLLAIRKGNEPPAAKGYVQPFYQGDRGSTQLAGATAIIRGNHAPDLSTALHEYMHAMTLLNPDLNAELSQHFESSNGALTPAGHEAAAKAWESYLHSGKVANSSLKATLDKITQWMTNIYHTLKGTGLSSSVHPEVRAIFDRLVSTRDREAFLSDSAARDALAGEERNYRSQVVAIKDQLKARRITRLDNTFLNNDGRVVSSPEVVDKLKAQMRAVSQDAGPYTVKAMPSYGFRYMPGAHVLSDLLTEQGLLSHALYSDGPLSAAFRSAANFFLPMSQLKIARQQKQAYHNILAPLGANAQQINDLQINGANRIKELREAGKEGPLRGGGMRAVPMKMTTLAKRDLTEIFNQTFGGENSTVAQNFEKKYGGVGFENAWKMVAEAHNPIIRAARDAALRGGERGRLSRAVAAGWDWYHETPGVSKVAGTTNWVTKVLYPHFRFRLDPRHQIRVVTNHELQAFLRDGVTSFGSDATSPEFNSLAEQNPVLRRAFRGGFTPDEMAGSGYGAGHREMVAMSRATGKNLEEWQKSAIENHARMDPAILSVARKNSLDLSTLPDEIYQDIASMDKLGPKGAVRAAVDKVAKEEGWDRDTRDAVEPWIASIEREVQQRFNDYVGMHTGTLDRSGLERIANSYWLYWPLSYRIRTARWLTSVLTERALGMKTGLLGLGALNAEVNNTMHRMATIPAYRKWAEQNPEVWSMMVQMLPLTPWDTEAELNRFTRYVGGNVLHFWPQYNDPFEPTKFASQMGDLGPTYTAALLFNWGPGSHYTKSDQVGGFVPQIGRQAGLKGVFPTAKEKKAQPKPVGAPTGTTALPFGFQLRPNQGLTMPWDSGISAIAPPQP